METVACPITNSTEFTDYLQLPDRFDSSGKERWTLVRSAVSGLIMLNPRPDSSEITHHYHSGQYDPYLHDQNSSSFRDKVYLAARSFLLRYRAKIILKGITKPMQQLSILEIGCSTGALLDYFHRKKGVTLQNLAGVEPDTEAAKHARKHFGLQVYPSLHEEGFGEKTFDRIVLWHTLEHIHAINETVELVAKKLAPEGVLVIALPNPASFDAGLYRENWIAWDAPRHLYHFVPGTLEKLLELHNLNILRESPYFPDTLYNIFHSEKLLSQREKQKFNALRVTGALLEATAMTRAEKASSLVYYCRKKTGR